MSTPSNSTVVSRVESSLGDWTCAATIWQAPDATYGAEVMLGRIAAEPAALPLVFVRGASDLLQLRRQLEARLEVPQRDEPYRGLVDGSVDRALRLASGARPPVWSSPEWGVSRTP